jgi:hypothetical protein
VARVGLIVFAIFYAAFEITLGIGTGILADEVNGLPAAEQAAGAELVESYSESGIIGFFTIVGTLGLAVGMIAAVLALRSSYGLGLTATALLLLAMPLIAVHEPPYGPIGLAMFIVATVLLVRQRRPEPTTEAPPAAPVAA